MKKISWFACGVFALGGVISGACGGDDEGDNNGGAGSPSAGSPSAGSPSAGTGGSPSGGSPSGGSPSGGTAEGGSATAGTAGAAEAGAAGTGTGGAAGAAEMGGAAGAAEMGGAAGAAEMGCPDAGAPPVTEHNVCDEIDSQAEGDEDFTITSPDFEFCGEMDADLTCDGKAFGTGSSPELNWSGAPEGTGSFALVFKDISILADGDPAQDRFGYHWVMWDIPPDVDGLPAGLMGGHLSEDVDGARQWAGRNEYGFFPPCPNPFPADDERFSCGLVIDSYAFTLYALEEETLDDLPAPDIDPDTDMPTGNWVVNMGHYIESLDALAVAEYRGTSGAWATSFGPPDPVMYPCTADMIDNDMTDECLAGP